MADSFQLETLEERIKAHGCQFESLLKTIPAQYYITKELSEEEEACFYTHPWSLRRLKPHYHGCNSKYQHNKKRLAPKQEIKERTKKAKKAKLDPENVKSVSDIQSEMAAKSKDAEESDDDEEADEEDAEDDEDEEMAEPATLVNELGDDEEMEDDSEAPQMGKKLSHVFEGLATQAEAVAKNPAPAPKSITELRAKLEARLADLRSKRGGNAGGADASGKPVSRQAILEARLKRKRDRKASLKLAKEKRANGSGTGGSEGLVVKDTASSKAAAGGRPSASSINDKGEVRFSKFEFEGMNKKKKGPTDAKGQLKQVEKQKEKLAALQASNPEKASAVKEKDTWKKALQLAQGDKVKDDAKLLKKTIKREETLKKKKAKDWSERKSSVKKAQDQKLKKREENIQSRIDAKKNKGKKGSNSSAGAKKGGNKAKGRAGFEGKHNKKPNKKPSKK
ncbi:surfeit locus protein [Actinomortierella ambigua]|nr:surfeit locus protein [Actinomortierella ambigua]